MRPYRYVGLVLITTALLSAACATSTEWVTWRQHPTHFASGDHLSFSVRNRESQPARVTHRDVAEARDQGWWGDPIAVKQAQILER
jgi:Tfp pilus assembly protein PilN